MIDIASLNCGEKRLLEVCKTRLRIAELLYMGHITWGDDRAATLINKELIEVAVARCRDGKAKELTPEERKYFYPSPSLDDET